MEKEENVLKWRRGIGNLGEGYKGKKQKLTGDEMAGRTN